MSELTTVVTCGILLLVSACKCAYVHGLWPIVIRTGMTTTGLELQSSRLQVRGEFLPDFKIVCNSCLVELEMSF